MYLLLSMLSLTAVLILYILIDNADNKIEVDKNLFKVNDQTRINKVILTKAGEEIELSYNGSKWMVNNTYEADRQLIQVFFATLLQAEPRRPVALRVRDSIRQQLKNGVEVKLYEGDLLVKNFLVKGSERKTETYYELTGDETPYLVTIPGYRVYVAAIFELSTGDWREKRLFNFNWQNFKRLVANFKNDDKDSFVISFQDDYFGLEGIRQVDTTRLNDYLDAVSLVQANRYLNSDESHEYDSILSSAPFYSIEVTDIANRAYRLDLFPPQKNDPLILGKLGDGQGVFISREDFIRLDRKKGYFTP